MNKAFYFFLVVLFIILFASAVSTQEPEVGVKAKYFNTYIKERNQGDERAIYYDKMSVKNIVAKGCFPIIPRDTNKNITAICDPS